MHCLESNDSLCYMQQMCGVMPMALDNRDGDECHTRVYHAAVSERC